MHLALANDLNHALESTYNLTLSLEELQTGILQRDTSKHTLGRLRVIERQMHQLRLGRDRLQPDGRTHAAYTRRSPAGPYNSLPRFKKTSALRQTLSASNQRLAACKAGKTRATPLVPPKPVFNLQRKSKFLTASPARSPLDAASIVQRCERSFRQAQLEQETRLTRLLSRCAAKQGLTSTLQVC